MPRTLIKSRLHSDKHKPKIKQEVNNTKSSLPPYLQTFKQKLLAGNLLNINKITYTYMNTLFYFI